MKDKQVVFFHEKDFKYLGHLIFQKYKIIIMFQKENSSTGHYNDVIMDTMVSQVISLTTVYLTVQIKENIKVLCHWLLCREFTGDQWITLTNGQ